MISSKAMSKSSSATGMSPIKLRLCVPSDVSWVVLGGCEGVVLASTSFMSLAASGGIGTSCSLMPKASARSRMMSI